MAVADNKLQLAWERTADECGVEASVMFWLPNLRLHYLLIFHCCLCIKWCDAIHNRKLAILYMYSWDTVFFASVNPHGFCLEGCGQMATLFILKRWSIPLRSQRVVLLQQYLLLKQIMWHQSQYVFSAVCMCTCMCSSYWNGEQPSVQEQGWALENQIWDHGLQSKEGEMSLLARYRLNWRSINIMRSCSRVREQQSGRSTDGLVQRL